MQKKTLIPLLCAAFAGLANAAVVTKTVAYEIDGEAFEGVLVYDDSVTTPRPGLLAVPNWMGVNEDTVAKAARAAGDKYVVFVADMYGKSIRPGRCPEHQGAGIGTAWG